MDWVARYGGVISLGFLVFGLVCIIIAFAIILRA